jgi:hypothetical protein
MEGQAMRRRDFIILLAGAMSGWPSAVRAELKAMPVVGYLSPGSAQSSLNEPFLAAFRRGLSETGYLQCSGTLIAGVPVALCSGVTDRYSVTRSANV